MSTNEPIESRFRRKTKFNFVTGCIEWTAAKDRDGYGFFRVNGKFLRAHRVALVLIGVDVPSNKIVLHKCDNPSCVNPLHLSVGTSSDNMKDCVAKKRQKEIRKISCPKGHPYTYIVARTGKRQCTICRKVASAKSNEKRKRAKNV